jgi:hypothetical protein
MAISRRQLVDNAQRSALRLRASDTTPQRGIEFSNEVTQGVRALDTELKK